MYIQKRYQYYGPKGIIWSHWFNCFKGTEEESKAKIIEFRKIREYKFKSEYQLINEDN